MSTVKGSIVNQIFLIGTIADVTVGNVKHRAFLPTPACNIQLDSDLEKFVKSITPETKETLFSNLKVAFGMKAEEKFLKSQWEKCVKLTKNAMEKKTIGKDDWEKVLYQFNWGLYLAEMDLNVAFQQSICNPDAPDSEEGETKLGVAMSDWPKAFDAYDLYLDLREEELAEVKKAAEAAKAEAAAAPKTQAPPPNKRTAAPPAATTEEIPAAPAANTETGVTSQSQNMQVANNASLSALNDIFSGLEDFQAGLGKVIRAGKAITIAAAATEAQPVVAEEATAEEEGV